MVLIGIKLWLLLLTERELMTELTILKNKIKL